MNIILSETFLVILKHCQRTEKESLFCYEKSPQQSEQTMQAHKRPKLNCFMRLGAVKSLQ